MSARLARLARLATSAGPRITGWLAAIVIVTGLVAIASQPTGAASPGATVHAGGRVAASAPIDRARVLLVAERGDLHLQVAYPTAKGWLTVVLAPVGGDTAVAWTSTSGKGPVPAFSAVYGRTDAARVEIAWSDGSAPTAVAVDAGTYLAVREGDARPLSVTAIDGSGAAHTMASNL